MSPKFAGLKRCLPLYWKIYLDETAKKDTIPQMKINSVRIIKPRSIVVIIVLMAALTGILKARQKSVCVNNPKEKIATNLEKSKSQCSTLQPYK
jgi:hypothetical protein